MPNSMRILGIESSCDETALALVKKEGDVFVVEQSLVSSQIDIHKRYGGVVPEVAAREHTATLFPLLAQMNVSHTGEGIDAIAVTAGPGLVPALRIGVELAKGLAWMWNKPLVAVNHLEGHIYSVWSQTPSPAFPALCLLVSGGHTELLLMKAHGEYELIGMTRDDAAGEAFDKVAKILGLGYPGGPAISEAALLGEEGVITFPRPMRESHDFDFSFSGLKTAVRVYCAEHPEARLQDVARAFEEAVVDVLVAKTMRAVQTHHPRSVILSGGVSANRLLKQRLSETLVQHAPSVTFHTPPNAFTGDNAAMIALAGAHRFLQADTVSPLTLEAQPNKRLV